jgi:hypothetical protein
MIQRVCDGCKKPLDEIKSSYELKVTAGLIPHSHYMGDRDRHFCNIGCIQLWASNSLSK